MTAYPLELCCEVRLSDGGTAGIRPIHPDDATALEDFHEHLSSETVYRRFFTAHPHLGAKEVERYTHVDYWHRLALIAEVHGELAAVARYDRYPGTDRAEVAFVVADALQGHGVGALLLEHLAAAARRRGVAHFVAQTLGSNYPMQHVFRHAGFNCVERWVDGVIEVAFPIGPTQRYLEAVIQRDVLSVRARVAQIPYPRKGGDCGHGGLGLSLETGTQAEEVVGACRSAGLDVATVLVGEELGLDPADALLYLGWGDECDAIAVMGAGVVRPRRSLAIGREAARSRPVVALLGAGAAGDWAAQAGVEGVIGVEDLIDRSSQLLAAARAGSWQPPHRGQLVDLPDCDLGRAREALDAGPASDVDGDHASRPLRPEVAHEVLAAYGIATGLSLPTPVDRSRFVIEDDPQLGLVARAGQHCVRLLPLTDRDAVDLVEAAAVGGTRRDATIEFLLRAARLIDDQPDVTRVEVAPLASLGGEGAVAVWTGRQHHRYDDPFVRRFPAGSAATEYGAGQSPKV